MSSSLGQRLLALRQQRDWSQRELARRAGMNQSLLSRLEHHPQASTSVPHLRALAEALGVTVDVLLGISEERASQEGEARGIRAP